MKPEDGRAVRRTRWSAALPWGVLLLHLVVPASYYGCREDREDERFAWRMFSEIRMRRCSVALYEGRGGELLQVELGAALHASWISNLERGRRRVIRRFLESRCTDGDLASAVLVRSCSDVTGRVLPDRRYQLDCSDLTFVGDGDR